MKYVHERERRIGRAACGHACAGTGEYQECGGYRSIDTSAYVQPVSCPPVIISCVVIILGLNSKIKGPTTEVKREETRRESKLNPAVPHVEICDAERLCTDAALGTDAALVLDASTRVASAAGSGVLDARLHEHLRFFPFLGCFVGPSC